ncbi:MAG: T9SS type A sorting domain-containing protein, partial [Paludibacter sp.]|nr:T9SS type A sorting domain-containing protein [Paludibacter sp.]
VCDPVNKQVTYYVDGVRDLTVSAQTFEACTGGFRIGAHKNGSSGFWHGKIDELYFFRGLLSGDEIRAIRDNTYFDGSTGLINQPDWNLVYNNDSRVLQVVSSSVPAACIAIYTTTGVLVRKVQQTNVLSVHELAHGVYIVQVTDNEGGVLSKKILIN